MVQVRQVVHGAAAVDEHVDSGSEVDVDHVISQNTQNEDVTNVLDVALAFELVMRNGMVINLQADNQSSKRIWIRSLRKLVAYWSARRAADADLFKSIRRENLAAFNIDERSEAYVGQYAEKWEVSDSVASAELYNVCGIASCRAIHMSGVLYRKPRLHALFTKCHVILCHGHLIVFRDVSRAQTGRRQRHVDHERVATIDLKECYLYSGLLSDNDLLYQNRTFDNSVAGTQALPRMYVDEAWSSIDDDAMTTFVIWHSQRKALFKSGGSKASSQTHHSKSVSSGIDTAGLPRVSRAKQRIKKVSQLGTKGRSIVFRARSRAERDHWVMGITTEIEKLQSEDGEGEVRLVDDDDDD